MSIPAPGSPALNVLNAPVGSVGGAVMVSPATYEAEFSTAFVPNKTFHYALGNGTKTFYAGQPADIPAALKTALVAQGFGS
jgi:hypothetical protein